MDTQISDNDVTNNGVEEFTDETLFVKTRSGRVVGSWHCSYLKSKYFTLKPLYKGTFQHSTNQNYFYFNAFQQYMFLWIKPTEYNENLISTDSIQCSTFNIHTCY